MVPGISWKGPWGCCWWMMGGAGVCDLQDLKDRWGAALSGHPQHSLDPVRISPTCLLTGLLLLPIIIVTPANAISSSTGGKLPTLFNTNQSDCLKIPQKIEYKFEQMFLFMLILSQHYSSNWT